MDTNFWFVPLEIFRNKRNPEKVVPFSRWKRPNGKFVFHLQILSSLLLLSPVQYFSRSIKRPGHPRLPRIEPGTRFSQTEIPKRSFPKFFVNGKRLQFIRLVS